MQKWQQAKQTHFLPMPYTGAYEPQEKFPKKWEKNIQMSIDCAFDKDWMNCCKHQADSMKECYVPNSNHNTFTHEHKPLW
jgi:hypothetical protein